MVKKTIETPVVEESKLPLGPPIDAAPPQPKFAIVQILKNGMTNFVCDMELGKEYRADEEYNGDGTQTLSTFDNSYHRTAIELARVEV